MERKAAGLTRSQSDPVTPLFIRKSEMLLPAPVQSKTHLRVRALLGHCLYRRLIIWIVTITVLFCLTLTSSSLRVQHGRILDAISLRKGDHPPKADTIKDMPPPPQQAQPDHEPAHVEISTNHEASLETIKQNSPPDEDWREPLHWLRYSHMDGYFNGIKALVPLSQYVPEFPAKSDSPAVITVTVNDVLPKPTIFVPQPDYRSVDYTSHQHAVKECYLDKDKKVPAPDLYAYNGVPQGVAMPALGSHSLLGIRDDICWDRYGRYGPYGFGYSLKEGGTGEGVDAEREGADLIWDATGKINFKKVDWGTAQDRCVQANKDRFVKHGEDDKASTEQVTSKAQLLAAIGEKNKLERIAVVVRVYVGFSWSQLSIINFRAMISELSLRSGGEYSVHFLLHVKDDDAPIWADAETTQDILDKNMPEEFHTMTTLWSEAQMRLLYPGNFGESFENPSNADIHGVYRSAHMPLQHFAMTHSEYGHFWNWEMDMRYVGNYYELFDRLGSWARNQSRVELWERSQKYYIPSVHGDWDNFTNLVHSETMAAGRKPIFGPVNFEGKEPLRGEQRGHTFMPESCIHGAHSIECGKGEDADLITLNPIFDANESGWVFASDVTGYDIRLNAPPRRTAIVTASRLSRRLLQVMHEETWRLHHGMFAEMFPASMALHRGLKAVYAPHPVYVDRGWDVNAVDRAFNGGRDHTTSSHGSPFDVENEHNHAGTSWYYNSQFGGLLWRRWLGFAQMDGRGADGGREGEGTSRGGPEEERRADSTGRLCLRSMLVHPIKWENPSDRD